TTPKYWSQPGARAALYGWECLVHHCEKVVICEGELDRLCLESHGITAVTSTGGAGVFKQEWCKALQIIPEVYICFDNDAAGWKATWQLSSLSARTFHSANPVARIWVAVSFMMTAYHPLLSTQRPNPSTALAAGSGVMCSAS